jgi:hypothetical protein
MASYPIWHTVSERILVHFVLPVALMKDTYVDSEGTTRSLETRLSYAAWCEDPGAGGG